MPQLLSGRAALVALRAQGSRGLCLRGQGACAGATRNLRLEAGQEGGPWPWVIWRKCTLWRCSPSVSPLGSGSRSEPPSLAPRGISSPQSYQGTWCCYMASSPSGVVAPHCARVTWALPSLARGPHLHGFLLPCIAVGTPWVSPRSGWSYSLHVASHTPSQTLTLSQLSCSRCAAAPWLLAPLQPPPVCLPSLLPSMLGFDPEVCTHHLPPTPSPTSLSKPLPGRCQALDGSNPLPSPRRSVLRQVEKRCLPWKAGILCAKSPMASPGPCVLSAASLLCPAHSAAVHRTFSTSSTLR